MAVGFEELNAPKLAFEGDGVAVDEWAGADDVELEELGLLDEKFEKLDLAKHAPDRASAKITEMVPDLKSRITILGLISLRYSKIQFLQ